MDEDSLDLLSEGKWYASHSGHGKWYAKGFVKDKDGTKRRVYLHRFVMEVTSRIVEVDHINGNTLDNRKCNLRLCSHRENIRNAKLSVRNKHGAKGVTIRKRSGRFRADIVVNGDQKFLGEFSNLEAAARAYDTAARKHFGEFAKTNFA